MAQTYRHARLCDLVDPDGPSFSKYYQALLAVDQVFLPADAEPPQDGRESAPDQGDPNVVASPLAEKLDAVNACPHRSDTLKECSCTGRKRCALNRGQFANELWAVTLADCLNCVSEAAGR